MTPLPPQPRFAVGYPVHPEQGESLVELISDYRAHVAEVYFAWPGDPSGRPTPDASHADLAEQTAQLLDDLRSLRGMGVRLDLLLNSSCYGGGAISTDLAEHVAGLLDDLADTGAPVDVVTTTSPAIAHIIRRHAPAIDLRASVNMRLGTIHALNHVADLFDSFYIQRDVQRNLQALTKLRRWADQQGKKLCLLANSGCLRYCGFQSFHDNLIAHADEARRRPVIADFQPLACRRMLEREGGGVMLLQATWIRPENLHHYAPLADVIKLATRAHQSPRLVLDAYARGWHHGNVLDLFEPGLGPALAPTILDNDRFPDDWFDRTSSCAAECDACGYCDRVYEQVCMEIPA